MSYPNLPAPAQNYPDQDCCPECGSDWKRACPDYCSQYVQCQYPPGCTEGAAFGVLCPEHRAALSALFAPAESNGKRLLRAAEAAGMYATEYPEF